MIFVSNVPFTFSLIIHNLVKLKAALIGDMPETVLTVFQMYIESANKGLANWMFRYKGTKILQALSLPATLPADFVYATLTK